MDEDTALANADVIPTWPRRKVEDALRMISGGFVHPRTDGDSFYKSAQRSR